MESSKTIVFPHTGEPRYIHASDGTRLAVWVLGPEVSESTIVWVHANGFTSRMWLPVIRALECKSSVKHILFDLRGQGLSSKPDPTLDNYDWHRQARDLVEVLESAANSPVDAVGHSMGGTIVAIAASDAPQLFDKVALFEPIIAIPERMSLSDPQANPLVAQARRRRSSFSSIEECRNRLGSKPPYSFFDPSVFELYLETALVPNPSGGAGSVKLACPPEVEAINYVAGGLHDGYTRLGHIKHRMLLMQGSRSPKGGFLDASALVEVAKDAVYLEVERTTHFAPFEQPKTFASKLCHFWKQQK